MPERDALGSILPAWLQIGDVRSFDPTPLSTDEMTEILAVASLAPSAANVQPWEFMAISDPAVRAEIATVVQDPFLREAEPAAWVAEAPLLVVACLDRLRARARFGEPGERLIGVQDVAIAVHLTRIRARSLGISSAWIREIDLPAVARCLALPRELVPQAVVAFGRSAQIPERVPHLRVSDFVRWVGGPDAEA